MNKIKNLKLIIKSAQELIKIYSDKEEDCNEKKFTEHTVKLIRNVQECVEFDDFMQVAFRDKTNNWKKEINEIGKKLLGGFNGSSSEEQKLPLGYNCFMDINFDAEKLQNFTPWAKTPFMVSFKDKVKVEHNPAKVFSFVNWIFYSMVLYPWHSRCYTDKSLRNVKDVINNSIEVGGI